MGDFCARTRTPCLFPETLFPDTSPDSNYTIYLSKGLPGEAEALAIYLRTQGTVRVTQVCRLTEPAQTFRAAFQGAVHDVPVAPCQALTAAFWNSLGTTGTLRSLAR